MTLTLDLDTILAGVTTTARTVTGVRLAYDYDEWPDSPPGMFNKGQALHLTGFPEDGQGWIYTPLGTDLSEYKFDVPMYTVVIESAKVRRSRGWAGPLVDAYRVAFDSRNAILAVGAGNTGSVLYGGAAVVRHIPDWPDYSGFYMLRHVLHFWVKGPVVR